MSKKFNIFASMENETDNLELEGGVGDELEVSESLDESEMVANEIVDDAEENLEVVSGDEEDITALETDIDGLSKDIDIAEKSIEETGVAPEVTIESIRMRVQKAKDVYRIGKGATGKHFSKENYVSVSTSKTLSKDALEAAKRSFGDMVKGFFKSISISMARSFKVLESIDKNVSELITELKSVKEQVGESAGKLEAGVAKHVLANGNVWSSNTIDVGQFGTLINRNVKATNTINGTHKEILEIVKEAGKLSTTSNVSEDSKEIDKQVKQLQSKLDKIIKKNIASEKEPLAGGVYVELLEMRVDLTYDKSINVGKSSIPKGDDKIISADGKTLTRMIDSVINLLESTSEVYKDFKNTYDEVFSTGGKFQFEFPGKDSEQRDTYNRELRKRILINVSRFTIGYLNEAVGTIGQSNLRLGKMLISYANASVKATTSQKPEEVEVDNNTDE